MYESARNHREIMEVLTPPAQSEAMRSLVLIAGCLIASATERVDVTIYQEGQCPGPAAVEQTARSTVSWLLKRAGVRVVWRNGVPVTGNLSLRIRFASAVQAPDASAQAMAYAMPFGDGSEMITILCDRIQWVARRTAREGAILAYVLAHEIGHILQRTNAHRHTGIMKAHWSGPDYDEMERKRLWFTADDIDLIRQGIQTRKDTRVQGASEGRR